MRRYVLTTVSCHTGEKHVPDIRVMKAMSDLCWVCQQNSAAIVRSTNLPIKRQTTVRTCIINNYM